MTLQMIQDYKNITEYRQSFNKLAGRIFGIDFEKWYQLGFWNDRYVCHSFVDGNQVVANVSTSRLDIIWQGARYRAVQIGTVMTDPEYRNQGLAAKLMKVVLAEYENHCDVIYLFANPSVLDFYPRFGFFPVKESRFSTSINEGIRYSGESRRLDLSDGDDIKILKGLISDRISISGILDVDYAENILAWHCLNIFPRDIYYLKDLDVLVICQTQNDTLHLYDVIGRVKPEFMPVFNRIAPEGVQKVVFYFSPEFADVQAECHPNEPDDVFFMKSARVRLTGAFFYPITAHA